MMEIPTVDTRAEPLDAAALDEALAGLSSWTLHNEGRALRRTFQFASFDDAWEFLERVAAAARRLEHHPQILNRFSRVEIVVWTFECQGVTAHDVALARAIDAALEESIAAALARSVEAEST